MVGCVSIQRSPHLWLGNIVTITNAILIVIYDEYRKLKFDYIQGVQMRDAR